jgi:AcrR family transcriptional regulator
MARKESITKQMILNAAFTMTKEEGLVNVTARRLADHANCSTQPIFRIYRGMEELYNDVYEMAINYFSDYYINFTSQDETPFVNLGLAYINFAEIEPHLFKLLFLEPKRNNRSLYELLNGTTGALVCEINKAKADGAKESGELFMKMWIFIHGAACMTITGDYDLSKEQTLVLLKESYNAYRG